MSRNSDIFTDTVKSTLGIVPSVDDIPAVHRAARIHDALVRKGDVMHYIVQGLKQVAINEVQCCDGPTTPRQRRRQRDLIPATATRARVQS